MQEPLAFIATFKQMVRKRRRVNCYGNYGMTAPGPIWNQWLKPINNVANTSVLALPDKLLALWEGGTYALDLQTLETWGEDDLAGLANGLTYSAHYKRDPHTGEVFNLASVLDSMPR